MRYTLWQCWHWHIPSRRREPKPRESMTMPTKNAHPWSSRYVFELPAGSWHARNLAVAGSPFSDRRHMWPWLVSTGNEPFRSEGQTAGKYLRQSKCLWHLDNFIQVSTNHRSTSQMNILHYFDIWSDFVRGRLCTAISRDHVTRMRGFLFIGSDSSTRNATQGNLVQDYYFTVIFIKSFS